MYQKPTDITITRTMTDLIHARSKLLNAKISECDISKNNIFKAYVIVNSINNYRYANHNMPILDLCVILIIINNF